MSLSCISRLPDRFRQAELMDEPGLDPSEHVRALSGLGRVNAFSRISSILWPPIARLAREQVGEREPLRVLDLATGGGDLPIALARQAAFTRLNIKIDGCDVREQAVNYARRQANSRRADVTFFSLDALTDEIPEGYDIICCSLFLHHLDEASAVNLLRRMAAATQRMVLVNDLVRSRRGYLLALVGCRLLTGSRVVHFDGPASVASAFTPKESLDLASKAGLEGSKISRHWPERFLLSWRRE